MPDETTSGSADLGETINQLEALIDVKREELREVVSGRRPPPGTVPPRVTERVDADPEIFGTAHQTPNLHHVQMGARAGT
ncbi:MAG: hypothetical protein ACREXT_03850, partial [Gammaproteobacteria bacterium]